MKKAVFDTNFILNCVKQKIPFFDEVRFMGFKIVIPEEVLGEVKRLSKEGKKLHVRETSHIALKIIESEEFEKIKLNDINVDRALKEIAKKDKNIILATADRELKYKIKRPTLIVRGKKKIELV